MYLLIEENPNCEPNERMFSESGEKQSVAQVLVDVPGGGSAWCAVTGVEENGSFVTAQGMRVEDSSDGTAWLVFGAGWGLRLQPAEKFKPWDLNNNSQWGLPFLVLDGSGSGIRWA